MRRRPEDEGTVERRRADLGVKMFEASSVSGKSNTKAFGLAHIAPLGFAIILDGRLGRKKSDVPERKASPAWQELGVSTSTDPDVVSDLMSTAFDKAHTIVRTASPDSLLSATALKIVGPDSGRVAVIESIGRTRAYLLRGDNLELLTPDDGVLILPRYETEVINAMDAIQSPGDLDAFAGIKYGHLMGSYFWNQRHKITRALGSASNSSSMCLRVPVQAGDRLLLADPGVQNLSRDEIRRVLMSDRENPADEIVYRTQVAMADTSRVRSDLRDIKAIVIDMDPRVLEYTLQQGDRLPLAYTGFPIGIELPGENKLEIGFSEDLGFKPTESEGLMLILDREEFNSSNGQEGYAWLEENNEIVDKNLNISWVGGEITLTSYAVTKPVKVTYTSLK